MLDVKVWTQDRDVALGHLPVDVEAVSSRVQKARVNPNYGCGRGALVLQLTGKVEGTDVRCLIAGTDRYNTFMRAAGAGSSTELEGRGVVSFYCGEEFLGLAPNPIDAKL